MAGAKLKKGDIWAISNAAVAAMPDEVAFEALTMVSIANIVTSPSFGQTTNITRHNYIDTEYTSPDKGFTNGEESNIVVGIDPTGDAGQDMLLTASADAGRYVISVTRLDGSVSFAWGLIAGDAESGGGGEDYNEREHTFAQAAQHVTYTP